MTAKRLLLSGFSDEELLAVAIKATASLPADIADCAIGGVMEELILRCYDKEKPTDVFH